MEEKSESLRDRPIKIDWRTCAMLAVVWSLVFYGFSLFNMVGMLATQLILVWFANICFAWWHNYKKDRKEDCESIRAYNAPVLAAYRHEIELLRGDPALLAADNRMRVEAEQSATLTAEQEWEQQYHEHCKANGQSCDCQACSSNVNVQRIMRGL